MEDLFVELDELRTEIDIITIHLQLQKNLLDSITARIKDIDEQCKKEILARQELIKDE